MNKRLFLKPIFFALIIAVLLSTYSCNSLKSKQKFTKTYLDYFDTATSVIGYEESEEEFLMVANLISEELSRYHKLYDIYNCYEGVTNLALINKVFDGEHKTHTVDREIMDFLLFSKDIYVRTAGETNIAMGSVLSIWHDYRERGNDDELSAKLPDFETLSDAAIHTNIDDLILDEENMTVFIRDPEMTLDVGAVAKGYAVEMIARKLEDMGIFGYTLNVGGNIRTIGKKADGSLWRIGIENPDGNSDEPYIEYLNLSGESIVTSGSYQRFYRVDGKSYHHIIDKDTLYPSEYFTSVSVICEDSGLSDALSTALFSMSYEEGLSLIESIPEAEAIWYTKDCRKLFSSGLDKYLDK